MPSIVTSCAGWPGISAIDSFGGRQQLYERLHSGSPEVLVSAAYQRYDKSKGIAMVNQLIGA